jgi:hypothetical protein
MKNILPEMKVLFEMALNGATFNEIIESSEFTYLEMIMGEMNARAWYDMYIDLSSKEELIEYMNLPLFKSERG